MNTYLVTIGSTCGKSSDFIAALLKSIRIMETGHPFPDEIKVNVFSNCNPDELILIGSSRFVTYEWPLSSIKTEYKIKSEGAAQYLKRYQQCRLDLDDIQLEMGSYFEEQLPDEALEG